MSNEYLNQILAKYKVNEAGAKQQVVNLYPVVEKWGGACINESIYSGSIAKGTAISIATDADVFISLSSTTPDTLSQIYNSLFTAFTQAGYQPRKQNVSIGVTSGGFHVDFVPGKRQSQYGYDHSLYKNKTDSWVQTNVKTHITHVTRSARENEIKLTKIWRKLHSLDFPSFYLEMAIIDCLSGNSYTKLSGNFWQVLGFLAGGFTNSRYVDPANTNNVISDELSNSGKLNIKRAAQTARKQQNWNKIVW